MSESEIIFSNSMYEIPEAGPDRESGVTLEKPREHKLAKKIGAVAIVAAVAIGGIAAYINRGGNKGSNSSVESALTVRTIPKNINCGNSRVHIGALDGVDGGVPSGDRLFSDALEAPLNNPDNSVASMEQIYATICEDPLFGSTVANMFANMKVGDISVVGLNPWLKPYNFEANSPENDIAKKAWEVFPIKNRDAAGNITSMSETKDSAIKYKDLAERLITLLSRFNVQGRSTQPTTFNYVLSDGGLVAGEMPQVYLNPEQYSADAIVLSLTKKPEGCYVSIGFNVQDQRPEGFANCKFVLPPTTSSGSNTPHTTYTPNITYTPYTPNTPRTTVPYYPTTTTTTWIGPKTNPHPPVPGGETTTIPSDQPGGPVPTTSTTSPNNPINTGGGETTTTIQAVGDTTTTAPAGACGDNCN